MADNVSITQGSGTSIAADDISSVLFQRVKIALGADGVNDGDLASGNPMPVSGTVDLGATDNAVLDAIAASVAGTVTVQETARTLTHYTGTKASSGDNSVIAAQGAGVQIVISQIMVQNESSTATTMILKDGATAIWRALGQNQGDGLALMFPPGREWRLTANTALNLNLSGANSCGISVAYWTE